MARYIDADKIDYTVTMVGMCENAGYRAVAFESDIDAIPTADVVPRAEVERLKDKYEIVFQPKEMIKSNTRTEVAREIFEEIEKIAKTVGFPEALVNGMIVNHILDGLYIDSQDFAELKKKYTEEKK